MLTPNRKDAIDAALFVAVLAALALIALDAPVWLAPPLAVVLAAGAFRFFDTSFNAPDTDGDD